MHDFILEAFKFIVKFIVIINGIFSRKTVGLVSDFGILPTYTDCYNLKPPSVSGN